MMYLDPIQMRAPDDFRWKNGDASRTKGMCYAVYMFFGSSFGVYKGANVCEGVPSFIIVGYVWQML